MPESVTRFSVSLPGPLLEQLDAVVMERGLPSRSHAIAEMIRDFVLEHAEDAGERVMAGVITVVYANDRNQLRGRLQDIEHRYLREVISSQHVFLEADQSLEALLVQGRARTLHSLANELAACRGVHTVKLAITAALLPPLHGNEDD
jgi:CopG family transcriptional regulator, nickel-responsive regulator